MCDSAHAVCALVLPMKNSIPDRVPGAPLPDADSASLVPCSSGEQLPLERVLEGLGDGVWDWDMVKGTEYLSPRLKAIYGYTEADGLLRAAQLDALTHPDDVPGMQADRQAHWAGRTPYYRNEHRVRHKLGHWVWVLTRGLVISRDAHGQPLRMVGTHTDITERKQAALDHVRTRERLELAMQGANDGLWDWDLTTDHTHYSPRFQALVGYTSPAEFEQRFSFRSQLHPDDLPRVTSAVRAHLEGRTPAFNEDYRLCTRDGTYRWFNGRGKCSGADGKGCPTRFAGHLTDITARMAADQARAQLQAQLDEAHQRQAVSTLASQVGHDLQQLLAEVQSQLQRAETAVASNDAAASCVHDALQAARRARHLVLQMQAFSSTQTQHMQLLDLSAWVGEQCDRLRLMAPPGTQLTERLSAQPLQVLADGGQLEQVLHNLCFHAWQSAAQAPVCMEVSVQADPAGGVLWVVQDDGPAIAPEALPHVLQPFHPALRASGRAGISSLAVVDRLVAAHQGRVSVHSAPGEGCRVAVWLPRVLPAAGVAGAAGAALRESRGGPATATAAASQAAPGDVHAHTDAQAQARPSANPASAVKGGRHVVYIDDYEAMVYLIGRMLKKRGVRVTAFERAADALALVRANPEAVDLLVTDYNMPEFSGMDVVREVARLAPGLPMVITSGHVTPALRSEAQAAGVLEVLNKQDSVDDLAAKLAELLQRLPPRHKAD